VELFRALATCCEGPAAVVAAALELPLPGAADHAELFTFQLYPYASVYVGVEGMLGGDSADRVAGFWRASGVIPPAEPDHLAALLGLYAAFSEGQGDRARHLRHALLWEQLLSWLPPWLARVREIAAEPYARWARLVLTALLAESEELGPPATQPLHLRLAPPSAGLESVLAAVRSGVIVTRADIGRAARELGLGLRQGERRYALEALLEQNAQAVTAWLAGEASRQAAIHRSLPSAFWPAMEHWASRAEATADQLGRLAASMLD